MGHSLVQKLASLQLEISELKNQLAKIKTQENKLTEFNSQISELKKQIEAKQITKSKPIDFELEISKFVTEKFITNLYRK